jgi:hypothetical protein
VASRTMCASGKEERSRLSAGVVMTASPSQFVPRTKICLIEAEADCIRRQIVADGWGKINCRVAGQREETENQKAKGKRQKGGTFFF